MMRFRFVLPLAALLVVGSCRDAAAPVTGLASVPGSGSNLFTPLTDYSLFTRMVAANAAGTYVRHQGLADIQRITAGGAVDATSIAGFGYVENIDASGVVFGGRNGSGFVYYWLPGGSRQDVAVPTDEQNSSILGKRLGSGEIVIAVTFYNPSATPISSRMKLYRWSSVSGWALIATSLSTTDPTGNPPIPHGVTDDGSIVWTRNDPNLGKMRIYRTSLSDVVTLYAVPVAHIDGYQYLADGNSVVSHPNAVDSDGAAVGFSSPNTGPAVAVRWAPDGTPTVLPSSGISTKALAISGDYVIGTRFVTTTAYTAVRWKWNGSSWDSFTFPALLANSGPPVVRINSSGVTAVNWNGLATPGIVYGVPGSTLFRADNVVLGDAFMRVDDAGRVFLPNGIITPEPELTTAETRTIPAGVRMTLPLSFVSPLGDAAYPVAWSVRWEHGVSGKSSEGTFESAEDVTGPRHIYTTPGTYTARTIISDASGRADTTLTTITVLPSTDAPTAHVGGEETFAEGEEVVLTAASSSDPNSRPLTYKWRFDGQAAGDGIVMRRRDVPRGEHSYRLIVENSVGQADTATGTVSVLNAAPTGRLVWPKAPIHEAAGFDLSVAAIKDAPPDIDGVEIQFNCGNGYGVWGAGESKNCDGLPQGSYTVGVRLRDEDGAVREYTGALTVKNRAPIVTINHVEGVGAGQIRVVYRISDYVNDGPWVVTLQRNGTRAGGTQTTLLPDTDVSSLKILGQNGDVITVRVKDKDGAVSTATIVVALEF